MTGQPSFLPDKLISLFLKQISHEEFITAQFRAKQNNSPIFQIFLSQNLLKPAQLLAILSDYFKTDYYIGDQLIADKGLEKQIRFRQLKKYSAPVTKQQGTKQLRPKQQGKSKEPLHYELISPERLGFQQLKTLIQKTQNQNKNALLTDRASFRKAIEKRYQGFFNQQAISALSQTHKKASARDLSLPVLSRRQKLILLPTATLLLVGMALFISPAQLLFYIALLFSPIFLSILALKMWAVACLLHNKEEPTPRPVLRQDNNLPIYTILVPLYKEAKILPSLTKALLQLDYPTEKLDIKLLLEADDQQTHTMAKNLNLPDCFEIIIIPHSLPKTKPKALNYGLHFAYGDYLVIYDAEDRPEPDQLKKALHIFDNQPDHLACIQASLNIYNGSTSWFTRQFTQEYNALFCGLLPALSTLNLPFLLGGTSNHFKTKHLKTVGGWDAFNVTEDADLGIRLYRFGFQCTTLDSTTYEESCTHYRSWLKQRTRWQKGWMQTYGVHMQNPIDLFKELGLKGFLCFQIILGGQILASFSYLFFLITSCYILITGLIVPEWFSPDLTFFWAMSCGLFILNYLVTVLLVTLTLQCPQNKKLSAKNCLGMPAYWFLISVASLRALSQLFTNPFYWEKTSHGHSLTERADKKEPAI